MYIGVERKRSGRVRKERNTNRAAYNMDRSKLTDNKDTISVSTNNGEDIRSVNFTQNLVLLSGYGYTEAENGRFKSKEAAPIFVLYDFGHYLL